MYFNPAMQKNVENMTAKDEGNSPTIKPKQTNKHIPKSTGWAGW